MKRLASVAVAATLTLGLAFVGNSTLSAQEEKKPVKKPPLEKKDKGEAKKEKGSEEKKEGEEKKSEPKSDADKAPEPTDEKQAKQFKRIRDDVERKFRKSKREMVYVYATSEKTLERIEPTEEAAPSEPPAKGRAGAKPGGAIGGGSAGQWELVVKNTAFMTKDREDAVEKVYKFLVEFPPPAPGSRKKKPKVDDEPPPPERSLLGVQAFPTTKDGEVQAEAYHQNLEDKFRKEQNNHAAKKMQRKKGG